MRRGAARRQGPHLRTRVGADGMDYKGYNIAVHELGHNVEQVFSLYDVDHTLLAGVPNTAFTEALAFVFQARDLELLGLAGADAESRALQRCSTTSGPTCEIAGVALVDMADVALDVRAPGRHARPSCATPWSRIAQRDLEPLLRAGLRAARTSCCSAIYSHMVDACCTCPTTRSGT